MNIYVRNLSPETSPSELLECFELYGEVTEVSVSTYIVEGKSRGSAFVEMPSEDPALAAVTALQGREPGGNQLRSQEG